MIHNLSSPGAPKCVIDWLALLGTLEVSRGTGCRKQGGLLHLSLLPGEEVLRAERQNRPQIPGVALPAGSLHGIPPLQLVHT